MYQVYQMRAMRTKLVRIVTLRWQRNVRERSDRGKLGFEGLSLIYFCYFGCRFGRREAQTSTISLLLEGELTQLREREIESRETSISGL